MEEKNVKGDVNAEEELDEIEEIQDENGNDITDWKGLATKRDGTARRYKTKLEKTKTDFETYKKAHPEIPKEEPKESQDKKDFDLAEKSYLLANGIKKSEFQLVLDETKESGKSIDEILESKYFQEKLENKRSQDAIPSGTKRSGVGSRDEVDYWVRKGEYPPNTPENTELRRKVANALVKQTENKNKFSSRPIT